MQLDVCTGFGIEHKQAKEALRITNNWLLRAKKEWLKLKDEKNYSGLLFPIVQGNFFKDLRKESADFVHYRNLPTQSVF